MDQRVREDIAAAAAVHNELGREYDGAVAESLIDRIGDEIDRRVDARLSDLGRAPIRRSRPATPPAPPDPAEPARRKAYWLGSAVGAAAVGLPGLWLAAHGSFIAGRTLVPMILLPWLALVITFVVTTVRRRSRGRF